MLSDPNDESPANIDAAVRPDAASCCAGNNPDLCFVRLQSEGDVARRQGHLQKGSQTYRAPVSAAAVQARAAVCRDLIPLCIISRSQDEM